MLKTCLDCGDLADGTRCPACQTVMHRRREAQRGNSAARGYDRRWRDAAAAVLRTESECAICGTTDDLSVDHIVPKVAGGTDERTNLRTLCRRHNGAKGKR